MEMLDKKFKTVINKNTYFFHNTSFEEKYEGHINSLKETLLVVKNEIETKGLTKKIFENLLENKQNGLKALLALTGFSNEYLKRVITVVRVTKDYELSKLMLKKTWCEKENPDNIKEWGTSKIVNLIHSNPDFRKGIVNLFFEGSTIPFLSKTLPLFELKKLSISKLNFEVNSLVDTIIRYKEKGSYNGKKENNPEFLLGNMLIEYGFTFETGDLNELLDKEVLEKRTMDFIIPNKVNPQVIIESSFLVTTSSAQGDKSKTEGNIKKLIGKYYPNTKFIGFVDGIGWYVRKGDLKRMVAAYDDVFTFHRTELKRFFNSLKKELR